MSINSLANLLSANDQYVVMSFTTNSTSAGSWSSTGATPPSAGNTANGVSPTSATAGFNFPSIYTYGGNTYLISADINFHNNPAFVPRLCVFDRLFHAGAYAFNASTALSSQPSFSSRLPNTDYKGLELWVETVTATTGALNVNVTYTNENGVSNSTGPITSPWASPTVAGAAFQLPLASGDNGIQSITNVVGTVASAGTFNVMIMRRIYLGILWIGEVPKVKFPSIGLTQIYQTSALCAIYNGPPQSTTMTFGLDLASK